MLQDNTFKDFIASGFACCNKLLKDGTKCNCALRVIDTTHNKSCGIFTIACTKVPTKQDKEPHVSTFRTQCITDGDFALNRLAVTAEFVTGGSLTQLHQREDLLKLARTAERFWWAQTKRIAEAAELMAEAEVELRWRQFWLLPFMKRIVEQDARHDSARSAAHTTVTLEVLSKETHQVIYLLNVETKSTTNNAWSNEDLALQKFLDRCWDEKRELCCIAHDSCKSATTMITEYNTKMTAWAKANNRDFTECVDANDMWHGTKSLKKRIHSEIDGETKVCLKVTKKVKKTDLDDEIAKLNKDIARVQMDRVFPRLVQIFQQTCNAAKDQPELAWTTWQTVTYNCLVKDDHTYCQKLSGVDCFCARDKRVRDLADATLPAGQLQAKKDLISLVETKYNSYLVEERMARAAATQGSSLSKPVPRKKRASSSPSAGAASCTNQSQPVIVGESADLPVHLKPVTRDPFQPVDSQVTHPIALAVLLDLRSSADIKSMLTRHCPCVNTSFVESLHNVILIYAMKRKHFHETYNARIGLAVLDWNENILREHLSSKKNLKPKTFRFAERLVSEVHHTVYWEVPKQLQDSQINQ